MFKRLLSSTIALSIAFSPAAAAESTYVFRYKSANPSPSVPPTVDPDVYGVGNDITAYYVAPIGADFEKVIPVATTDVVEWVRSTGDWPDGIDLDTETGRMSGIPTTEGTSHLLYHGFDAAGNKIARANLNFTVFQPVGVGDALAYYGHTGEYFYQKLPLPSGVDVSRWEPLAAFPPGMSASGLALSGTPTSAGTYGLGFRGFDYMGREVAYLYGDILIEDGPKIEFIDDQEIELQAGETFSVDPVVRHRIGSISYELVAETPRPQGLTFRSTTGGVTGAYPSFDTTATFHLIATDSADGTKGPSNSFTLSTAPATIELSALGNLQGTVNQQFRLPLTDPDIQPGAQWALTQGQWPVGISLDPVTGLISGIPTTKQKQDGLVIELSGPNMTTTTSAPISFTVFPEKIDASFEPVVARTNTSFSSIGPSYSTGAVAPFNYDLAAGSSVAAGLALDAATGIVSSDGIATAGSYGLPIIITNGDGQKSSPIIQAITVLNPLSITYAAQEVKRLQPLSFDPVLADDSIHGTARYTLVSGSLPSWLSFNQTTGRFSGRPVAPSTVGTVGPFIVEVTDETGQKAPSNPFSIKVLERDALKVELVNTSAERFVTNNRETFRAENVWGSLTYTINAGSFPSNADVNLAFNGDYLTGSTKDPVGTVYSDFMVTATDDDGAVVPIGPFSVTVIEPEALKSLQGTFDVSLRWTRGVPFSIKLPTLSNTYGTVSYSLDTAAAGLTLSATGTASGTINEVGTTSHPFQIADETARDPARGTLSITILDPMTITADPVYLGNKGSALTVAPVVENAIGKVRYTQAGSLPKGMRLSNGKLVGAPEEEGAFGPIALTGTDEAGTAITVNFDINVAPPLPFSVSWSNAFLTELQYGSRHPKLVNALGTVTYKLTAGTLPKGIRFYESGPLAGQFTGVPREYGRFDDIKVDATDTGLDKTTSADNSFHPASVELRVRPAEAAELTGKTFTVRQGIASTQILSAKNVVAPLAFTPADSGVLPWNLVLNGTSGTLTGTFPSAGTFGPASVIVTDDFGRKATGKFNYIVLDDVSAAYPSTMTFNQYAASSQQGTTTNLIGTAAYRLSDASAPLPLGLSVNPTTGAVEGTPEEAGTFDGIIVEATDSFDGVPKDSTPFSIQVEPRLQLALDAPVKVSLKRWQTASAGVTASNGIGAVTYAIDPQLPAGLTLNPATGSISGYSSDIVSERTYTVTATDSKGGASGTSTASFTLEVTERDPLTVNAAAAVSFNQYFAGSVSATATNAIGGVNWTVSPQLPHWATLTNGTISGTPPELAEAQTYRLTAADAHDIAFADIEISVGERLPLLITTDETISAILNHSFGLSLATKDSVGEVAWNLVSGDLPDGLHFDAATGAFSGTPIEFGDFEVIIEATDAKGGQAQRTFKIEVRQDGTEIGITAASATVHIGQSFTSSAPNVTNSIGTLAFAASGLSGSGLAIDPATGVISGVPTSAGTISVAITVTDVTGRSSVATVTLEILPEMTVSVAPMFGLTYNYASDAETPTVSNAAAPATWSLASGTLPIGLSIDPASGAIGGTPKQIGSFSNLTLTVTDATGSVALSSPFAINVVMNDDPIELAVTDFMTHVGYPVTTAAPKVENELGTASFFHADANTQGLALASDTGVLTGTINQVTDAFVNISVRDTDTLRVTSRPLRLQIVPPQQITAPTTIDVIANEDTNIAPLVRQYAVGAATWSDLDHPERLPDGITFDPATGSFVGAATLLGTYGPFTVSSTDSVGDTQTSNAFSIRVRSGSLYLGLDPTTLAQGVKRTAYSFDFKSLLTAVGVDEADLTWKLTADAGIGQQLPPGLSLAGGILSGTPTGDGTFAFTVEVSGGGTSSSQTYSLTITLPVTKLELQSATLPEGNMRDAYSVDLAAGHLDIENIPPEKVTWTMTLDPASADSELPAGLSLNGGKLSGMFTSLPASDDGFKFKVTASFVDGNENIVTSMTYRIPFKQYVVTRVATGDATSCFLTGEGGVKCVGDNTYGQVGDGSFTNRSLAADVVGLTSGVKEIGGGFRFFCALTNAGGVKCWGINSNGHLGNGLAANSNVPVDVTGLTSGVSKLSVGYNHACALLNDKSMQCWGYGTYGRLGTGNTADRTTPVTINVGGTVADITAGGVNTCALLEAGTVKCWGRNNYYQNGDNSLTDRSSPVTVTGFSGAVKSLSSGNYYNCAVLTNGGAQCWGYNADGEVGDNTTTTRRVPTAVSGLSNVSFLDAGMYMTCAIENGGVKCWGKNDYGELGDGTATVKRVPTQVVGLTSGITHVDAMDENTCAATSSGRGYCWGQGAGGRLGNGKTTNSSVPVRVYW